MEIARDDKEGRDNWTMRGFRIFDAPVLVINSQAEPLRPDR